MIVAVGVCCWLVGGWCCCYLRLSIVVAVCRCCIVCVMLSVDIVRLLPLFGVVGGVVAIGCWCCLLVVVDAVVVVCHCCLLCNV